jgi:hypothetical protein
MKKLFLFLFLFSLISLKAQELTIPVQLLSKVKAGNDRYIGQDAFGGEYTIADNEFRKQKDGKTYKYKNISLGEIFKADIQNPLQIVLFYKKFNSVVLLDNQLNEITRINFSRTAEPLIAEAASLASQNRLWIFDITTQQIGLFDTAQNSYKTLVPPLKDIIKYYQSDYNYFYWIDTANKCYAVNVFGKVVFLGSLETYEQAQFVSQNEVLLKKENSLYLFNIQTGNSKHIDIVEKSFKSFYYKDQILSIFTEQEINHYKITFPE